MKCNARLPHHIEGSSPKSISSLRTLFYRQFPGLQAVVTSISKCHLWFQWIIVVSKKASMDLGQILLQTTPRYYGQTRHSSPFMVADIAAEIGAIYTHRSYAVNHTWDHMAFLQLSQ